MDTPNSVSDNLVIIDIYNPVLRDQRTVVELYSNGPTNIKYAEEVIFTDDETQSFRFRYQKDAGGRLNWGELKVTHLDSGESITENLPDSSNGFLIEEDLQQFSMWINDKGVGEDNQQMSLKVEETILKSSPRGCVPEAMNE
jgi:hypothetical protein